MSPDWNFLEFLTRKFLENFPGKIFLERAGQVWPKLVKMPVLSTLSDQVWLRPGQIARPRRAKILRAKRAHK